MNSLISYSLLGVSILLAAISPAISQTNLQPPVFNQSSYTVQIPENTAQGTLVTSEISASDPEGNDVVYSIASSNGAFVINESTGLVIVNDSSLLDYEAAQSIEVTIVASDAHSSNPMSNSTTLSVSVTDVNDNPPTFTQNGVYNFSVVENDVGAMVGTVTASDPDTVGQLKYFLQDTTIILFNIDETTGAIRVETGASLDADPSTGGQGAYSIVVVASDGVNSMTATVNIEVINIEDQRPFTVPISSTRLINLDAGETDITLTNPDNPLTVNDDGNVEEGVVNMLLLLNGVESSFPTEFASCRGSTGEEYTMCDSSLFTQLNMLSSIVPEAVGSNNPTNPSGTDVRVFNGANSNQARYLISGTLKDQVLSISDDFSISVWLKFDSNGKNLQYPISFEGGTQSDRNRYFSWLFRLNSKRLNLFYNRDLLETSSSPTADLGYGLRVGLSFYWDQSVFDDLRDDKWHFYKMDVDFPKIKFYIDGHVYYATEGHYHDVTGDRAGISDPIELELPARILDKTSSTSPITIAEMQARVGGSSRGNFNFDGQMRLLYVTSLMDNSLYTCLASCGDTVIPEGYVPGSQNLTNIVNGISTFYNPVSRELHFIKASSIPQEFTTFIRSISYSTKDVLPPEEQGEGRRIRIRVSQLTIDQILKQFVIFSLYRLLTMLV